MSASTPASAAPPAAPKQKLPVSPLAPKRPARMKPVAGVRLTGRAVGLKKAGGAKDLMLAELAPGTTIAGVLTRSLCSSAPVEWCRRNLPKGKARVLVVNSGNSNAFSGRAGDRTVEHTVAEAARRFKCKPSEVFVASTGVIGQPVPQDYIARHVGAVARSLSKSGWQDAAAAIMTTDTFPKWTSRTCRIGDTEVTLTGFAKGSGMIAPDMATMLGFLFTDAKIAAPALQRMLKRAIDKSFNAITVDGDTSTSDTVLLCATGQAKHPRIETAGSPRMNALLKDFARALDELCIELAQLIVRDGEGASKFAEIRVRGAESNRAAHRIGMTIANSPLVKTALAGEDANWGRIVMAVGKAGEKADRDKLAISIGGVKITDKGQVVDGYDEMPVAQHMKGQEIDIAVDIGLGNGAATVWTCDLTHGYISINGDYRS
jgi:glutamate N-acetyltransferase/amino-acid N-acetyltransferase